MYSHITKPGVPVWKRKNSFRGTISGTEPVIEQERNVNSSKKPITRKKKGSLVAQTTANISLLLE